MEPDEITRFCRLSCGHDAREKRQDCITCLQFQIVLLEYKAKDLERLEMAERILGAVGLEWKDGKGYVWKDGKPIGTKMNP